MDRTRKALLSTTRMLALAVVFAAAGALAAAGASAPPRVAYSTYLGGSGEDAATALAVDAAGDVYVAGTTTSRDFPLVGGSGPVPNDPDFPRDIFLTELAPDGSAVLSTLVGTEWDDYATAVALGPDGSLHVAGWVDTGGDVQVLLGTVDRRDGSGRFGIPFAGSGRSQAVGLAVNARGDYLIGYSNADIGDPHRRPGEADGPSPFVAEVGGQLRGSYFAGPCDAQLTGIALDPKGFIYVTGWTACADLPLVHPAQGAVRGGADAFVLKLDPADFSVVYLTYLGGGADDQALAIAVDRKGDAYVTGWTASADFPLRRPVQASLRGGSDLFVAELGPRGELLRSTYLGGAGLDAGQAIAVDHAGSVYLTGFASPGFPRNPRQASCATPSCDGSFVAKLDLASGRIASYSTFRIAGLGGGAAAVDVAGNVALAGASFGGGLDTVNALQPTYGGGPSDATAARVVPAARRGAPSTSTAPQARALAALAGLPLAFEENRGQTAPAVRFVARGTPDTYFLTAGETVVALGAGPARGRALHLGLAGADPRATPAGEAALPGRVSYLRGRDPRRWQRAVPSYARVRYRGVYPGVDLVVHGAAGNGGRRLEQDFVLAPGGDPARIRLAIGGADGAVLDSAGGLALAMGGETVRLTRPTAFQEIGGVRRPVASGFRLLASAPGAVAVGFAVGDYDRSRPLVIDPVVVATTYLGGGGFDEGKAIAVDAAGYVYVTGSTDSLDFPATAETARSQKDVYVAKLDLRARALVYSTIFGGSSDDAGLGIAVDSSGGAYAVGQTFGIGDFPGGPGSGEFSTPEDSFGFLVKLDASGSLVYSRSLGSFDGINQATAVAVDGAGRAYAVGSQNAGTMPFVAAFEADGSPRPFPARVETGCDPASDQDGYTAVAVDGQGGMIVGGYTGAGRAFVTRLLASGAPVYRACLGDGAVFAAAADADGAAYVTGETFSAAFPLARPLDATLGGGGDAFVAKLGPAGSFYFSTYLGGSGADSGTGIAIDSSRRVYVTGHTASPDFPLSSPPSSRCTTAAGGSCTFVTALAPSGGQLLYSGFLDLPTRAGGSGGGIVPPFAGSPLAADAMGTVYLTGTVSAADLRPVAALQPAFAGHTDAYVIAIARNAGPQCGGAYAQPPSVWANDHQLLTVGISGVTDSGGSVAAIAVTAIFQDEPTGGAPNASGLGTPQAQILAARDDAGDGRVYHISFTATGSEGATCAGQVTVCVPHDRTTPPVCGDGGALYSSTGG